MGKWKPKPRTRYFLQLYINGISSRLLERVFTDPDDAARKGQELCDLGGPDRTCAVIEFREVVK